MPTHRPMALIRSAPTARSRRRSAVAAPTSGPSSPRSRASAAPYETAVCIYLTDGYGDFPDAPPELPVLWVVTSGGRGLELFPFGEAVRLFEDTQ